MQNKKIHIKNKRKFILSLLIVLIFITGISFLFDKLIHNSKTSSAPQNAETKNIKNQSNTKTNIHNKPIQNNKNISTSDSILVTLVGDCTLGRDDKYAYKNSLPYILEKNNNDYSYFFKNVYPIFKNDNITIANLESVFTNSTQKASKKFTFKAPSNYAKILTTGSIEAVNISNNHTHDYLQRGFEDTKKALNNYNVPFFGEGHIWKTQIKGIKIAFLGYKGFYKNTKLLNQISKDVQSLKKDNFTVIINFHWGKEYSYYPIDTQKDLAHYAIDKGADLIIGHHPHVIEGVEKYKNKIICYSLGNFCFGGNKNPPDKNTMIVQTKFNFVNKKLYSYDLKIIPCSISSVNYINNYCPTPLKGDEKKSLLQKINNISYNLNFKINGDFQNIKLKNK